MPVYLTLSQEVHLQLCTYVLTRVALRLWSIFTPDSWRRIRSWSEISGTLAHGSVWCGEPAIRDFRTSSARIGLDLFIFRCIPSLGFPIFKDKYLFCLYSFSTSSSSGPPFGTHGSIQRKVPQRTYHSHTRLAASLVKSSYSHSFKSSYEGPFGSEYRCWWTFFR